MGEKMRKMGIDIIGDVPWGTHLCQFYKTREDLIDILVPYFKAGLENNEFCMWVTSDPLRAEDAKALLWKAIRNLNNHIEKGQLEILDASQWYTKSGKFEPNRVLQGWVEKENQALKRGFDGLRLTGNTLWLEKRDWRDFADYEAVVNNVIGNHRMIAICSYSLDKCGASEVIDVVSNHQFALIKREGKWELIESTEYKRAEEELRESKEKWRLTIQNAPLGIGTVNLDGKFISINQAYCDMLGYSQDKLLNLTFEDITHPDDREKSFRAFNKLVKEETDTIEFEKRYIRKDGSIVYVIQRGGIVHDSSGNPLFIIGIAEDITGRKRAEEKLKQTMAELIRSNVELEQFASVASHDLQEPLRMVASYVGLLAKHYKGKLDSNADEFIGYAVDGANRMHRLINDLLAYSRVGSKGKDFASTDCEAIFDRSLTNLKEAIEESGAVVSNDALPTVMADDSQLVQVFQNLIANAIKFRGNDPPHIHVSAKRIEKSKIRIPDSEFQNPQSPIPNPQSAIRNPKSEIRNQKGWVFSVRDNGIGIEPEFLERIFIPFQRLHTKTEYSGTGIGLAICKKIVERHGGCIWVDSEPEKGSTFYFTIPVME